MLLLATDTSGKHGSIALARVLETTNPAGEVEIIEVVPLAGGTFSAQLVPQIAALLAKHGFRKEEIGGFACASGPGSFTGLRVGLAIAGSLAIEGSLLMRMWLTHSARSRVRSRSLSARAVMPSPGWAGERSWRERRFRQKT